MTAHGNQDALFVRNHIHLEVMRPGTEPRVLVTGPNPGALFVLPSPGVYSLGGPNQVGKTLLVKFLIGVAPVSRRKGFTDTYTFVDGEACRIRDSADALRYGVAAVLNEDALIPTMTIRQQLLMRHTASRVRIFGGTVWEYVFHGGFATNAAKMLFPESPRINAVDPERFFYREKELLREAAKLLHEFGFTDILDKYPTELSTGGMAVARILQVLMRRNLRVLFLDEALSGVAEGVWPRIVDVVKQWQQSRNAALVVITHNREELLRWNPVARYMIRDATIKREDATPSALLVPGIPSRTTEYRVFEEDADRVIPWSQLVDSTEVVVIADSGVCHTSAFSRLLAALTTATSDRIPPVVPFTPGEPTKTVPVMIKLFDEVLPIMRTPATTVVVVGGGITLNVGGLVAALLYRGVPRLILVPTTIMAIADVAVGSKMTVNFSAADAVTNQERPRKHAFGVYANPYAVALIRDFLDTLPGAECRRGLAECAKHGLLQDAPLFESVMRSLEDVSLDRRAAYDAATVTLRLKANILAHDPWELSIGQTLLYGHMHAHALERHSNFEIPHGSSVFFGMLVELGCVYEHVDRSAYARLAKVLQRHRLDLCGGWEAIDIDGLLRTYREDLRFMEVGYSAIVVPSIGAYRDPTKDQLSIVRVPWEEVARSIDRVLTDVVRP